MSSYTWSLPTGATLVSGQGTNSIVVSYDLVNFESGTISVQATNSCGTGLPNNFAVSTIKGKISGPVSLCSMTSATYTVPSDLGTNFVWTLPQGMSITSGSGTSSITVSITNPVNFAISNQVSVSFSTPCGGTRSLSLTVNCTDYTSLKSTQCGATVDYDARIYPITILGAEQYAFDIYEVDGTTLITTIESTTGYFNFSQINFTFGATYIVKVRVKFGGIYGAAGSACNVTVSNTVKTTALLPSFCGVTIASLVTKIGANPVFSATGYRFEITSGGTTTVYDSPIYLFRLTDAGVATYGTTYGIRVAAQRNGVFGNYGASCNVTTPALSGNNIPTTTIMPSFCGTTLVTLATKIPATPVPAATGYRFEITANGITTVYNSALYLFKLADAGVAAYGTIYSIRVAALFNGVYGNYGTSCTVTTPGLFAPTRLKAKSFEVSAYPNPFDTAFNLNLETPNKEDVTIAVYDMMGKLVETHQVNPEEVANLQIGNNFASGIYNVVVSQANEMQAIRLIRK